MNTNRTPQYLACRRAMIILLAVTIPLLAVPVLYGQTGNQADTARQALPIKNPRFAAGDSEGQPVKDWVFEAVKLNIKEGSAVAKLEVTPKGEAALLMPPEGPGVLLKGTTETARGDLISAPFKLAPFRLVDVTVEYTFDSGEPLLFVCLRPTAERGLVDLDFLPQNQPGTEGRATVRLHSGLFEGDYSLALSIGGVGTARVLSIEARSAGDYPRPDKPVFVVDLLRDNPRPDGELGWGDAAKFVELFGFPSVKHGHFTQVTPEMLKAADPALIILSPKGADLKRPNRQKLTVAVQAAMDHGVPMVGICAGHQALPMVIGQGAFIYRQAEDLPEGRKYLAEWGPTKLQIVKNDPLFEGLPRYPYFYASESHQASVSDEFTGADVLASTDFCKTQIFHYPDKPWYTFQCHIERGWEVSCPEPYLFWKNMFRMWELAP